MRGEWIEILPLYNLNPIVTSLPMRGEWIEMIMLTLESSGSWSLPMRGEWIEIYGGGCDNSPDFVSPHAGRVD